DRLRLKKGFFDTGRSSERGSGQLFAVFELDSLGGTLRSATMTNKMDQRPAPSRQHTLYLGKASRGDPHASIFLDDIIRFWLGILKAIGPSVLRRDYITVNQF